MAIKVANVYTVDSELEVASVMVPQGAHVNKTDGSSSWVLNESWDEGVVLQDVDKNRVRLSDSSGGGFIANVYFRTDDSDVVGYSRISYTNQNTEIETSATVSASDGQKLVRTYLYDNAIETTILDAGAYIANYRAKVSNKQGETKLIFEAFLRHDDDTETVLFSSSSDAIKNVDHKTIRHASNQPQFSAGETDRFGVNIYVQTTRTSGVEVNTIIGGENASYFSTPIALRHELTRNRDKAESHPMAAITGLSTALSANLFKAHRTTIDSDITTNAWTDCTSLTAVSEETVGSAISLNADGKTIDINEDGYYHFGGCVHVENNTGAGFINVTVLIRLVGNGVELRCSQRGYVQDIKNGGENVLSYNGTAYLSAGDKVNLQYYTDEATLDFYSNDSFENSVAYTIWLIKIINV